LVNDGVSMENLDIYFIQSLKRWSNYKKQKYDKAGLCFQGFVELFITFSRLYFPEDTLEESISGMIYYCIKLLKIVGYRENDFSVTSKNGPVTIANKRVKLRVKEVLKHLMNENMEKNEFIDFKTETSQILIEKLKRKFKKRPLVGKITVNIINFSSCSTILDDLVQELNAYQTVSLNNSDIYLVECKNYINPSRILADILRIYREIANKNIDFLPGTWILPREFKNFSNNSEIFIVKSNENHYLIEDLSVLSEMEEITDQNVIIQEYIDNPLLINGNYLFNYFTRALL
jgi:hypothetical protein